LAVRTNLPPHPPLLEMKMKIKMKIEIEIR